MHYLTKAFLPDALASRAWFLAGHPPAPGTSRKTQAPCFGPLPPAGFGQGGAQRKVVAEVATGQWVLTTRQTPHAKRSPCAVWSPENHRQVRAFPPFSGEDTEAQRTRIVCQLWSSSEGSGGGLGPGWTPKAMLLVPAAFLEAAEPGVDSKVCFRP